MIKITPRIRSKKLGVPILQSYFTDSYLNGVARDLQKSRHGKGIKRERPRDDMVIGLHATINQTGLITFHIAYDMETKEKERCYLLLGSLNEERPDFISVAKARERAKTVKALAAKGINPQDGLYPRLWRELDEKGTAWKPK